MSRASASSRSAACNCCAAASARASVLRTRARSGYTTPTNSTTFSARPASTGIINRRLSSKTRLRGRCIFPLETGAYAAGFGRWVVERIHLTERRGRFEIGHELFNLFDALRDDAHVDGDVAVTVDVGSQRRNAYVIRQCVAKVIQEDGPRKQPLSDDRVRFARGAGNRIELFRVDRLARSSRARPQLGCARIRSRGLAAER